MAEHVVRVPLLISRAVFADLPAKRSPCPPKLPESCAFLTTFTNRSVPCLIPPTRELQGGIGRLVSVAKTHASRLSSQLSHDSNTSP